MAKKKAKSKKTKTSQKRMILTLIASAITVLIFTTLFMTFKQSVTQLYSSTIVTNLLSGWGLIESVFNGNITDSSYIIITILYILIMLTALLTIIMLLLIILGKKKYVVTSKFIACLNALFGLTFIVMSLTKVSTETFIDNYNRISWACYIAGAGTIGNAVVALLNK